MLDACGDDTHKKKGVEARRLDHLIADARLNLRVHDKDQVARFRDAFRSWQRACLGLLHPARTYTPRPSSFRTLYGR
jgi:hypothetical protein